MQKGALTRIHSTYEGMPYKPFAAVEILAVEAAFRMVWKATKLTFDAHRIDFSTASEEDISSAIVTTFDYLWTHKRIELEALSRSFYPIPTYDGKTAGVDYRSAAFNKRPDFAFTRQYTEPGVSALHERFFVEAKLITPQKSMGLYCGQGLERFVSGKYAWAVSHALMLGYVRDTDQALPGTLRDHFSRNRKKVEYGVKGDPKPFALSRFTDRMHMTKHSRSWTYPDLMTSPGDIDIYHLWLRVDENWPSVSTRSLVSNF